MSPPRPPLAPSGPPSGLNFSRLTEAQPWPPFPAVTWSFTRSTNVAMVSASYLYVIVAENKKAGRGSSPARFGGNRVLLGRRDDRHHAAPAQHAELDLAAGEGEQGVVLAAAHVQAGVEVGAALADDDLAGV